DGAYGHTDHIAISQLTTAAIMHAADAAYPGPGKAHNVSKLYYMTLTQQEADLYRQAFDDIIMTFDGVPRTIVVLPDWMVSASIQAEAYWQVVLQAILCHQSQAPTYKRLTDLPEAYHRQLCNCQTYYRVFSLVNGGRRLERDLFEGLR